MHSFHRKVNMIRLWLKTNRTWRKELLKAKEVRCVNLAKRLKNRNVICINPSAFVSFHGCFYMSWCMATIFQTQANLSWMHSLPFQKTAMAMAKSTFDVSKLFRPLSLPYFTLNHRIVLAPLTRYRSGPTADSQVQSCCLRLIKTNYGILERSKIIRTCVLWTKNIRWRFINHGSSVCFSYCDERSVTSRNMEWNANRGMEQSPTSSSC